MPEKSMGVSNLIQADTVYFMQSQILCPKLGSGWRQEKRERSGVGQLSGVEAVAYILVEEEGTHSLCPSLLCWGPVMRMQARNTGPWNRKARVYWTMCCCGPDNGLHW